MADETTNRITDETHLDEVIRKRLTCDGCGGPLHPVPHRNIIQWTCEKFGCSRMIPNLTIEGRIKLILMSVGVNGHTKVKQAISRYKKSLLGGK